VLGLAAVGVRLERRARGLGGLLPLQARLFGGGGGLGAAFAFSSEVFSAMWLSCV